MAGRYTPGPSALALNDLLYQAFTQSSDGKPGLVVVNTDGTAVGGGGGGTSAVNLTQVGGSAIAIGQAVKAASLPVVIASDQGSIGTVTANAGTNLNTSALALETGGNLATVVGNQTNGTQQSKVTDGTTVANVLAGDSGQNAQIVTGSRKEVTFTTTTVQAVASTDVSNYKTVSVHVVAQGTTSTVNFQGSNDNTNWENVSLNKTLALTSGGNLGNIYTSTTGTGIFYGPITFRYFRLNVTGISAGTTSGVIEFYGMSYGTALIPTIAAVQSGTWTVGVNNGLMPSGTSLNTFSIHLTSNTTTTPTASTAYVSSVSISSEVAGTTSTVTIQDKQGTPLKLVNGFSTTSLTTTPTVVNFQTPVKMVSGIDIITAGAVAATVDVWVNYYQ